MTPLAAAAAAAAGDPSSRRRRGRAPAQQQQQEQQQKLTQQGSEAAPQQAQAYAASVEKTQEQQQEQQQQQLRSRQLLWDTAAQLGLKRGSDIAPPEDTDGASIDLASDSSTGSGSRTATASRRRRSRASSSSSNSSSSSSRSDVGTAVSRSTSSSIEAVGSQSIEQDDDSVSDNVTDSLSLNSRDDAVVAAIARLGRFLDFRERCASEVLSKLGALGYDRQLAQRALQELQDAVGTACTVWICSSDYCVTPWTSPFVLQLTVNATQGGYGTLVDSSGMQQMLLCCPLTCCGCSEWSYKHCSTA
jgi:hypothetical protein